MLRSLLRTVNEGSCRLILLKIGVATNFYTGITKIDVPETSDKGVGHIYQPLPRIEDPSNRCLRLASLARETNYREQDNHTLQCSRPSRPSKGLQKSLKGPRTVLNFLNTTFRDTVPRKGS